MYMMTLYSVLKKEKSVNFAIMLKLLKLANLKLVHAMKYFSKTKKKYGGIAILINNIRDIILKGVVQLVCFLKIISLNFINFRVIKSLHSH